MAIISFKYNFIFIKTVKTAGTSIEADLSQNVEDDAIVTPIYPPSALHTPRNWETDSGNFYNHMSAAEVRKILGSDVFGDMLKFCVERDPITKCISHFHMLRNSSLHNKDGSYNLSWDDYCQAGKFPVDINKYTTETDGNRSLIVDKILRYENLEEDLQKTLQQCGIMDFKLKSTEKSEYSVNRLVSIREVTDKQRAIINQSFAETKAILGRY